MKNCPNCNSTRYKKLMGIQRCFKCGYVHKNTQVMLKEFEDANKEKDDTSKEEV